MEKEMRRISVPRISDDTLTHRESTDMLAALSGYGVVSVNDLLQQLPTQQSIQNNPRMEAGGAQDAFEPTAESDLTFRLENPQLSGSQLSALDHSLHRPGPARPGPARPDRAILYTIASE